MGEKEEERKKEEEEAQETVLRVDMHCEACARKVAKSLKGFEGVEEVKIDSKARTVLVKGRSLDPVSVCERVQKKSGRKAEIISPLPKEPEEKEEAKEVPPEENKEEPKPVTVILKVRMHCEACSHVLWRRIRKIDGVQSVQTDFLNEQVIVNGFVDPMNLIEYVQRRTRRRASIVPAEEKEEDKKTEGDKQEEKPQEEETKEAAKEEDDIKIYAKKIDYWPPIVLLDNAYIHPPELFSDENPNACSLM